jgi:hypothetical protein
MMKTGSVLAMVSHWFSPSRRMPSRKEVAVAAPEALAVPELGPPAAVQAAGVPAR